MSAVAVRYEVVDEKKVVTGFGAPVLDPEATKARARSLVSTSPEARGVLSLLRDLRASGKLSASDAQKLSDARDLLYRMTQEEARSKPVYFDTIPGEINLPAEVAADLRHLFRARPPHTALLLDGSIIPDNRGRTFWIRASRWASGNVVELGAVRPAYSVWDDELTPSERAEINTQLEADRVAGLTDEQRAAEKAGTIQRVKRAANSMRSDLEIEGDPRALETARRWYLEQLRGVEEKYT